MKRFHLSLRFKLTAIVAGVMTICCMLLTAVSISASARMVDALPLQEPIATEELAAETTDAVQALKNEGYTILSVEQVENSISLEQFAIESGRKYAFIFGNEVKGVQQEVVDLSDDCIEIPQFGTKHSFNISVTAGIVLWQVIHPLFYKQLK